MFKDDNIYFINKPYLWTSFDVLRTIKKQFNIKKLGHAGTLDPLATGLLIIATGKKTKEINTYVKLDKEYTGTFTLGATTPTYDLESKPENFVSLENITSDLIYQTAKKFQGELLQFPPIYSAIKQQGKPIYLLARKGIEVKLEPRKINILAFEITNITLPIIAFRVCCSSGTYIRSLAHDFGKTLNCGAYLSALCRTKIGIYDIINAVELNLEKPKRASININNIPNK